MSLVEIRSQIEASIATKKALLDDVVLLRKITSFADITVQCLKQGGKIIFAGNGGSFADAQHLSAEFVSRFMFDRAPMASLVLGANNSTISATGNDYGYERVFARELEGLAKVGDVFVPISTSGNSANIVAAVEQANKIGLITLAFTGANGGKLASLCDCLCVPSTQTPRVQECHIMLGHILCGLVESDFFSFMLNND